MNDTLITTLRDVEIALQPYFEASTMPGVGANFRLEKTLELAQRVGNPQQRVKVVHVAGTSGKTSTVYYTAALLAEAGLKVGMTVSPHVTSVAERVQLLDSSFDEAAYVRYFSEYLPLATANGALMPSFHDLMMVFALWVFDRENVDYAVLETGMGGMYDSSNICRREDKVCVITDIGLDHVAILGDTLGKIAEQKAGIIAEKNVVCMYEQSDEVMKSVQTAVEKYHATLVLADESAGKTYFDRNFQLATTVYRQLTARDSFLPTLSDEQLRAARATAIPGRLEALWLDDTMFMLDGAHNAQKLRAMFATLDVMYGPKKWPMIVALKHDKITDGVVESVAGHASSVVASEYAMSQDMPFSPTPAQELAELFASKVAQVQIEPDLPNALQQVIASSEKRVLVTGSFYAVSEARKWLLEHGAAVQ